MDTGLHIAIERACGDHDRRIASARSPLIASSKDTMPFGAASIAKEALGVGMSVAD